MSRWLVPLLAIGAYFTIAVMWIGADRRAARERFPAGPIRNLAPEGLALAWRYLSRRAGTAGVPSQVTVLNEPLEPTRSDPGAVLFRVRPDSVFLTPLERLQKQIQEWSEGEEHQEPPRSDALLTTPEEEWVAAGGRVILALHRTTGAMQVAESRTGDVVKTCPLWPGVTHVAPSSSRVLAGPALRRAITLLASGPTPIGVLIPMGKGELIVFSCPEIFENSGLARGDHAPLLEALVTGRTAVLFDEHTHGLGRESGAMVILRRWGLGPLVALFFGGAFLAFWRNAGRIGPSEEDFRESRREAVDFVDSLALLYQRALRMDEALALYYRGFARAVALQSGLRGEALTTRVLELTQGTEEPDPTQPRDLTAVEFRETLTAVNEGYRRLEDEKHR